MFAGYRIDDVLARGGMGVVYRATDLDLDRSVALKIIAPEHTQNATAVARFKAECRLAASLEHPNIVPIHRGGQHDGVLYLAMRLVPGTNLRDVIDHGPVELSRTAPDSSPAVAYRSLGSLAVARATISSKAGISSGRSRRGSDGGSLTCAQSLATSLSF